MKFPHHYGVDSNSIRLEEENDHPTIVIEEDDKGLLNEAIERLLKMMTFQTDASDETQSLKRQWHRASKECVQ